MAVRCCACGGAKGTLHPLATQRQTSSLPGVVQWSITQASRGIPGQRGYAWGRGATPSVAVRVGPMLQAICPVATATAWISPRGP